MKKNKNLEKLKRPTTLKGWLYELIPLFLLILFIFSFPKVISWISGLLKFLSNG